MVTDLFTSVYVADLQRSTAFYRALLDLEVAFESDWIVQLSSPQNEAVRLTLQPRTHELVPEGFQRAPAGFSIAFQVPSSDAVYARALEMRLEIVQPPRNEIYGQRRFLTVDPDGLLVDVSSLCEPSPEFVAKYMS